MASMLEETTYL